MTKTKNNSILIIVAIIAAMFIAKLEAFSEINPDRKNYASIFGYALTQAKVDSIGMDFSANLPLEIQCPSNISTYTDLNDCSADISSGLNLQYSGGTLNSLTWEMTGATEGESPDSGINQIDSHEFEVGVTFVNYTAKDGSGNILSCSFTVVVVDNQLPDIEAPENISIFCNDRIPTAYTTLQAFLNAGGSASDNCNVRSSSFRLISEEKDKLFCPYTITRNYQVADYSGNTSTVTQYIYVGAEDTITDKKIIENQLPLKSGMESYTAQNTGNWNDPNTWGGSIPTFTDDVTIPSGITVTVNTASVCNNINIQSGGTVNYSGAHTLRVYGNWTNNGTFNPGTSGTVEFTGSSSSTINGNTDFEELIINKNDINTTITINGTNSVSSGGSILLTGGLITIPTGSSFSINPSSGITINRTAGFDVTGGTLTTGNFSITNEGLIRVSSGTANFGSGTGNEVHTLYDGAFIVTGGNVNIAGRLYNSASGTLTPPGDISGISISGGTVTLATVGNGLSSVGSLNVTPAGNFNFTGGTIVFQRPSTAATELDLGLIGGGGTKNTVGGTFQFGNGSTLPNSVFNISSNVLINRITSTANADLQLSNDLQVNQLALNSASTLDLNGNSLQISVTGTGTYTFPIDDGSGNLIPVTITLNSGSLDANPYIEVTTTDAQHPDNANTSNFLSRYWTITLNDISNPNYNITVEYPLGDISGNESGIAAGIWDGSLPWAKYNTINTGSNTISASNITSTSIDFTGITLADPTVEINGGNVNETICYGSSVTLNTVASGDLLLSYSWVSSPSGFSSTSSSVNVNPLVNTTYTVTVTDGNGFTNSDDVDVIVNPQPVGTNGTTTICSGVALNYSLQSQISNGVSSNFSWTVSDNPNVSGESNGSGDNITQTLTNTSSSAQTVIYTVTPESEGTNCTGASFTVTVTVNPQPVGTNGTTTICSGVALNYSLQSQISNGVSSNFSWTVSDNPNVSGESNGSGDNITQTLTNTSSSAQTVIYTVTPESEGTNCPGASFTVIITVTPPISASATVIDPILCYGGTANIQITASGGTPPYTYNFEGKASSFNGVFTGIAAGPDYDWSVTDDNGCAAYTGTITVSQPEELTANANVTTPILCYGSTGTVTIIANGGTGAKRYTFNGITNSTGVFNNVVTGTYNWSVKDANNCSPPAASGTLNVTQPTAISNLTATVTNPITCNGGTGTVTISATGGTGALHYTFNGQTNTTGIFNNVYAGTGLSYSVTDDNGCGPVFGTINVNEPEKLSATFVPTHVICNGESTGSIDLTVSGGTAPYTFSWNNGSTGEDPTNLPAGTYTVTITDNRGCTLTTSTTITQPTKVVASVSKSVIFCNAGNSTVQITASGGTSGYEYMIVGVSAFQSSNTFTLSAGSYIARVQDSDGCLSDDVPFTISEPTPVSIDNISVVDNEICEGEKIELLSSASGGTGTLTYSWLYPDGTTHVGKNPIVTNATTANNGTFSLTVSDVNGCNASDVVNVTVHPSPDVTATPSFDEFCSGGSTNIALTSSVSGATFTWTVVEENVSGAFGGSGNLIAQTLTATSTTPGTATYTITPRANNCDGEPVEVVVTVNPELELTITNNTPVLCMNGYWWWGTYYTQVSGDVNIVLNSNVAGATYHWNYADGTPGTGNTIKETIESTHTYTIYAESNGCYSDTLTSTVTIIDEDVDLDVNLRSSYETDFCPDEEFLIYFYGGATGGWDETQGWGGNRIRTEYEWETKFLYTVSNPNVVINTSGDPIDDGSYWNPAELRLTILNPTDEVQTAVISITPWAYIRNRVCTPQGWWWDCGSWSGWDKLCSGNPLEITITVQPFAITCPTDIVTTTDIDDCFAERSPGTPVTTCPTNAILSWDAINDGTADSGSGVLANYEFLPGTTTVTYTAEDNGEYRTCSFDVTVTDEQDPTLTCPGNTTIYAEAGKCGADFNFTVSADDNCSVTLTQTDGTGLVSGSEFPVGVTTLSFYAEDEAGNSATCSFDVEVIDTISPILSNCVGDQTVCAPAGLSYVNTNDWDPVVDENCSTFSLTYTLTGDNAGTGSSLDNVTFAVGTTFVEWIATDSRGNESKCNFIITVNQEPAITLDPISQSACLNSNVTLTVSATGTPAPTYQWRKEGTDLSGESNSSLILNSLQAGDAGNYDVVVTNSCGSVVSASASLTVSTPPVITSQPTNQTDCLNESVEFTVAVSGGETPYSYAWEMRPTPTDAWVSTGANNNTLLISNIGTGSNLNGAGYKVTVTDNCGNSIESSIATLTVNQINVQPLVSTTVCQGENTTFSVSTFGSTPVAYEWLFNGSLISDGGVYSGTTTPTLNITNAQITENGTYSARVTFNISQPNNNGAGVTTCQTSAVDIGELIVDEGPDIVAAPANQTICPGSAITEIVLTNANGTPGTTYSWTRDNTTILTGIPASGTGNTINGILNSEAPTSLQTTVFTITATANGCVSTSQVTVSVIDDETPTVTAGTCPANINVSTDAGSCGAIVNYTAPTFDDNCDGLGLSGTMTSGLASGSTFPKGTTTVTYEYTDTAGNGTATCSFDVTVTDDTDPVAVCRNITVQLDATGVATITPADINNGSSDNCGTPILSLDITSFDCTDLGDNTVILTATDSVGNTSTCSATVTVKDDINPVEITATVSQEDTLCLDDITTVDIIATSGVGTFEYTFNGVTNATGRFTVQAGYTYAWSVTNTLGCGTTSGIFFVEAYPAAETPVFIVGSNLLCQDSPNETYTATATNSNSVSYTVLPAAAGTINSTTGEMDWDAAFSGAATITATATGFCNVTTQDFVVDITPTVGMPTAITVSAGTEPTCQLTNGTTTTTYSTTATNSTGFNWSISNSSAGSIDPATGIMTWADGFSGNVDIQVTANGCNGPSAQVIRTVNITPTVGTPSIPTPSDSVICQGSGSTTYTTFATDATDYNWSVTGAGNSISGTGTTATVTWAPGFSGTAIVSVTANGCNGPSASVQTTVNVLPTPTATISGDNSVCRNTASPDITFTNPQNLPVTVTYNINSGASQTINIAANSTSTIAVPTATVGDFDYNLVSVEYQSTPGCTNSISGTATVTIRPEAPVAPVAISGNDYVLPVTTETYTIASVTNATSYNWTVPSGWTIISGQGTTSITVTTGIAGEGGEIKVIAQNDCGDSPETALTVDINPDLSIITQPVNQTDCNANSVLFSVTISGGAPPISYVWQRKRPTDADFSDISGDPDISYPVDGQILVSNIGSASNPDGTQYRVRITDNGGSDETSNPALLTVNQVLTMSPVDVLTTICEGEDVTFSATTGGETPISMRWEKDGVPVTDDVVVSGSGSTTISLTGVRPTDSGEYRLAVTFPMTQPNNDPGNPGTCVVISTLYRTLVVNPLPVLAGPDEVCIGQNINWTPNTGGTWTSSDPLIATIADDGLVTGIAEGTVTFTFTETATGCSATTPTVTVHPLPTGEIAGNSDICAGESATFTVTLTGTSPWNIIYTDGTTADTVLGITTSPYTLTVAPTLTSTYTLSEVSDVNCDATSLNGNANVTVYPLPTATLSGDTTVCVGSTAELLVELTGVQPWSIAYTDGITLDTVSGITSSPYLLSVTPGSTTSYSLTAVSDNNCSGTSFTGTATVQVDQLPTASAGGSDTICVTGTATVSGANATDGTILWTHNGAGTLTDETTLTPTYTAATSDAGNTVTLTLTVTSNNTCFVATPATATYTIVVDPLPVATAGGSETICTDGTTIVSGASSANGTILWSHNGSGTLTDETTLTPSYTAGSSDSNTNVTLTMTVTSDNECYPQTDTATFTVIVLPEAQVNQPDSQEVCTGTSTDMISFSTSNTIGTTTYSWTNSEPSIGLAASGTGSIIAPFTAVNGGTDPVIATIEVTPHFNTGGIICDGPSKIFTITVNPQPTVVAPIGLTFCNGILSDTVHLNGTPAGVVFDISGGASIGLANVTGVTAIPPFTAITGSASLTIIPRYGDCNGLPVSFNVTVRPTPIVTISGGATVCQNSTPPSIVMTNPMTLPVLVTYSINGSGSYTVNVPARSNVSIAVPTNVAGIFDYNLESVQYLDSNPPTCPNTSITGNAVIEVVALPVPTISGPTDICAETTDHVYVTEGGMSNYTWVVSGAGIITAGGTSADSSVTITWTAGGSHNISVRYNNTNGCSAATATVFPVNVFALPIPTITGSTSACLGSTKIYSTQPGMTDYQWNVSAGGTIISGGGLNDNSVTIIWDATGAQSIGVNYTSADGCEASSETVKNITINPLPEPTISGLDTVCAGTSGNVYITEPGMSTYVWTVSAGGTITSGGTTNSNSATIRWNTDGPQTVTITYINPSTGCSPDTATVYDVYVYPKPVPTITGSSNVCVGSTGNNYTTESGMDNYVWTVSAGGTITAGGGASDDFVTITWNTTGAKTVRVNYDNATGCSATTPTTQNVTVHALPTPVVAGASEVCLGSTVTYSTVSGMTNYEWTVSSGGTIVSGGTTTDRQVTVTWNNTGSETISLNYANSSGCSAAAPTDYTITVNDLPNPTISGPSDACNGGSAVVYSTQGGMTAYIWSVTGGSITAGGSANDSTVTIVWNTTGVQTVSVNYYDANSCPATVPFEYPVNVVAPAPPSCPANMAVCDGDASFILSGATPAGGIYSGNGVSFIGGNYIFDPAAAGPGVHTIDYTMPNICADNCDFTITVTETPVGSASNTTICSGEPVDIALNSTVSETTFSWTASVISGSVSGYTNCSGSCGTMITDTLINNSVSRPGSSGSNGVVRYTVTAVKDGCPSTFTVDVTVRPAVLQMYMTWNSNFVEDFIEVCAGSEALSSNDIEILIPPSLTLPSSGYFNQGGNWNPRVLYGPSADGPWTAAPGYWNTAEGPYQWAVDLSINNQLGYHYFVMEYTDPATGCVQYTFPAILNVVSSIIVEAGDPEYLCGGSTVQLTGSYVGGLASSAITGRWSITSLNPSNGGNNGTLSSTSYTTDPAGVTYTPPTGYEGEVTLTLTTNDPSGVCVAIEDTRTIRVVPPTSFNGCIQLADWALNGSNSDGYIDDGEEPCLVTLVGSDNQSGSTGITDMLHCTGTGTVSFDWAFLAPPNKIVWHQEDQKSGSNGGTNNRMYVAPPSNIAEGDLIIVTIHVNNSSTISNSEGFTLIRNDSYSGQVTVATYYKIATAADVGRSANYVFNASNVSSDDRIYASRITGHSASNPIGNSRGVNQYLPYPSIGYMSVNIPAVNVTNANSLLVHTLSINIIGSSGQDVEYINSPIGSTTMYYNDIETTSRVSTRTVGSGSYAASFSWPSYNSRNRSNMYVAAQSFVINPATNEEDAAYFILNGTPTLLSNTNGATGSSTVSVSSSDDFGFRVRTTTNTGGPGRLVIYNLSMPNDAPVATGQDTVYITDCQTDTYDPEFVEPVVTDDCGTPVIQTGYPTTGLIVSNGCTRMQTRTWVYVDDCGEESEPFVQTVVWTVQEPIVITCPTDPLLEACTDPDSVTARYNEWVAGFTASGGCDLTTNLYAVPPLILTNIACGDTLEFTFIVSDGCGQVDSCTSTFTVKPVTTLNIYCPTDTTLAACSDTATISAAYNAWKAGFWYDGGCADVTDNMDAFPVLTDFTCGGQLEFIYIVYNSCGQYESCVSHFIVETPDPISIDVPAGVSLPLCSSISSIETAYNDWKAGFSYTGGCNVITNIDSIPDLGDINCGGTITFTYSVKNGNSACEDLQEGTSTFSVAEAPELIVSCPKDTIIPGCLGIQAITDAYDTWVDGFRATGGCNITTNIDSIPPLGDMICNGSITFTFVVGNDSTLCSDHVECTSTFTIGAAPLLEVITPADTAVTGCNTDQDVIDAFNAWKAGFDYVGGCDVSTSDISVYDLPSSCGGTVTVFYTVWDNCSQAITDSASFTLNPDMISVNAPLDEVQNACQTQEEIDIAFADWKSRFGFNGGCGTVGTDLSLIDAPNACGGTIVINYTAQDVCGQVVNASAIFTIDAPSDVLQEPSFTRPADMIVYRDDVCGYDADTLITGVPTNLTDNCTAAGNLTMVFNDSIAAGSCPSEIIIYRTWTVLDNCMNETSQVQLITVQDTTPPVINCAADANDVTDPDACEATGVNIGSTTADDNCALASLVGTRSDGLLITDPYPVGITTITWTATDVCGNSSECIQTVTIVDNQPPVVTCPAGVDQDADPNNCYRENVVITNPTIDENCSLASITWRMTGATTGVSPATGINYASGETFNVGITTVTYYATDISGNIDSCSFTVTIHDITPPVIDANCTDATDYADADMCSKVPATLVDPDYHDDCWPEDSLIVTWVMTGATVGSGSGFVTDSSFNVGVTEVTYYVSDPDSNETSCTFYVTILDVTPPEMTAGCTDVSETALPDECSKIPTTLIDPDYSDTCWPKDSLTLSYTITGATTGSGTGIVSGVSFNVGVSTVKYIVTDPDRNKDSCSFTVTILDVTPPVIDMDGCIPATDYAEPDSCSKIPATITDPDYSDTCWPKDSLTLSYIITGATTGSGTGSVIGVSFNVGVSTVKYIVADPDENKDSCWFTVTILDVTPPNIEIGGCEDATDTTDMNNCTVIPAVIQDPVYSDDCWPVDSLTIVWTMRGATTGNGSGSVRGETFNTGITTVTYIVSDPDENKDSCSFTVTILPYDMPAFTTGCPPDVNSVNDPDICGANLTIPVPTVDDPCNLGYVITNDRTGTNDASGYYPVDTTYVVWTITPTIGDPSTCTQMVVVSDVEDPIIVTCPVDQNIEGCDTTAIALSPAFSSTLATSDYLVFANGTNQGSATDNCAVVRVTYIDVASGTCPLVITRTWTVYDAAGNSATCNQTITIGETEPPVVDCPADIITPSVFDSTFANITLPDISIYDNCTDSADIDITWTISGTTNDSGTGLIPSPYHFNQGVSVITYTYTDACGNPTVCTFEVNVLYPPDITCLPPDTLSTDPGLCANHIEPGDPDNPGVPSNTTGDVLDWVWTVYAPDGTTVLGTGTSTGVSPTPVGPVDFPIGTSTIHWYASNLSGHDECDQLFTVIDDEPPTFTANPFEDCVEPLFYAVYSGDADDLDYDPDYPNADYNLFELGDTSLDIDLGTYIDNCCDISDGYTMRWEIDFEGNDPSEPSISGTGQPSTYINPNTGLAGNILLWGDGVNFQSRVHTITYWITDCNGNESAPVQTTITVSPRPELIKITN